MFNRRNKVNSFILFVVLNSIIHAQEKNDQILNFSFYSGNNRLILNEYSSSKVKFHSIVIQPPQSRSFLGLRIGYVKEYSGGRYSDGYSDYYVNNEVFYYIQPQLYIQGRYFGAVPGMLFIRTIETEDGPGGLVLPTISLRFGVLNEYFLSVDVLNEIYFGLFSINIHYLFKDNISKLMLGIVKSNEFNYTGISYEINFKVFNRFYLAIRGNINTENSNAYTQIGAGYVL